jgi:hypothetical protein
MCHHMSGIGNFGYVSYLRATEKGMAIPGIRLVQEGPEMRETLAEYKTDPKEPF